MHAMEGIIEFAAPLFIAMELASLVCLLLFGVVRYGLDKRKASMVFIFCLLALLRWKPGLAGCCTKKLVNYQHCKSLLRSLSCTLSHLASKILKSLTVG